MALDPKKHAMPTQEPQVRAHNFEEVALGYTEEQALDEAARCLNCPKHPCMDGCPVQISIPEFIQKIVEKDYMKLFLHLKSLKRNIALLLKEKQKLNY